VEPYAVAVIPLTEQSNDLITKRYHVPPEFFGGPMDVGYYVGQSLSGGQGEGGAQTGPPLVASEVLEKEPYTTGRTIEYNSTSQTQATLNAGTTVERARTRDIASGTGTATTRQQLVNDRQLVGRLGAEDMLRTMGVNFPTVTFPDGHNEKASA